MIVGLIAFLLQKTLLILQKQSFRIKPLVESEEHEYLWGLLFISMQMAKNTYWFSDLWHKVEKLKRIIS